MGSGLELLSPVSAQHADDVEAARLTPGEHVESNGSPRNDCALLVNLSYNPPGPGRSYSLCRCVLIFDSDTILVIQSRCVAL